MRVSLRRGLPIALALIALSSFAGAQPKPVPGDAGVREKPRPVVSASARAAVSAPVSARASASAPVSASASAAVSASASASAAAAVSASASATEPPPPSSATESPSPSVASASAPAPAPSGGVEVKGSPVRLRNARVFSILVPRDGRSPEERAADASAALARAVEGGDPPKVDPHGDTTRILVGTQLIIELGPEDAIAAGDTSLKVHADKVAADIGKALEKERSRNAALMTLGSFALVIMCGVIGVFLVRKLGNLADRMRGWIRAHPGGLPAIKLQSIEVIRPESFRAALLIAISAGRALVQIAIVYSWILITLWFLVSADSARQLTHVVFGPLYEILGRVVGSLPLLVVVAIAAIAMVVLIRFVGLFFDGVARGETTVDWLPADLAAPTSVLVRGTIVLTFLVIAAPLVTGDDGALARAGMATVVALGLSATPLLACVAVGVTVVYGRGLRVGDFAEVGGRVGKVSAITLLDVRLEDEQGGEVRVPHLLGLLHPTRVLGPLRRVAVEVVLAAEAAADAEVSGLLEEAATTVGKEPRAEIVSLDADGARYRVTVGSEAVDARSRLYTVLAQALSAAEIPLGRGRAPRKG